MDNKELLAHPFVRKMLSEDEREKHIITHYPSSNGPTQQLSSLHRTEKQLACQLNWMRYLFRLQGMIADEERVDARLLRFIILKQMFTQLHSLTEALNGRNPYFFANWNNFLKEFDKVKRYDEILKNYAARYESLRQLYADLEGHLAGRRELEGIREDFELAEAMSIMAVVISVREIRRMCELIRGERILAKALEVAKVLDFVVTYYQLNCLLVDDFRRIDYFEDRSKLDIIIEGLAVEMDAKAMGELLEKINYIGLLEDARHLGIH